MKTTTYVLRFERLPMQVARFEGGQLVATEKEYADLDIARHAMMDILAEPVTDKLKRFAIVGTIRIFRRTTEEEFVEAREVKKSG